MFIPYGIFWRDIVGQILAGSFIMSIGNSLEEVHKYLMEESKKIYKELSDVLDKGISLEDANLMSDGKDFFNNLIGLLVKETCEGSITLNFLPSFTYDILKVILDPTTSLKDVEVSLTKVANYVISLKEIWNKTLDVLVKFYFPILFPRLFLEKYCRDKNSKYNSQCDVANCFLESNYKEAERIILEEIRARHLLGDTNRNFSVKRIDGTYLGEYT